MPAFKFISATSNIFILVLKVAVPECGVKMTLGNFNRAWSRGSSSGSVTSNAAVLITPFCSAFVKSAWLTTPPREILTSVAVGFIIDSSLAVIMCFVSCVRGVQRTTKSDRDSSSARLLQYWAPV